MTGTGLATIPHVSEDFILLAHGDPKQAQRIFEAFAERTALDAEPVTGGMRFTLAGTNRNVKVIETLNDIDVRWDLHVGVDRSSELERRNH